MYSKICPAAKGGVAYILDEPVYPITVVQLLVVCLGKEGLLSEGSEGEETCQALAEMAKDGRHCQGIEALELARSGDIIQLHFKCPHEIRRHNRDTHLRMSPEELKYQFRNITS